MAEKLTQEEVLRKSFEDAYTVLVALGPHCESIEEMTGLIGLAVGDESKPGNDAQLRILLKLMKAK